MAILDWLKEAHLSAVYNERLVDSERQISVLEQKVIDLSGKVANLEQEKIELQAQLEQSEQGRRALEEQIKQKLIEVHNPPLAFDDKTGAWTSPDSSLRYCAKCKIKGILSPLKNGEHEWTCPACGAEFKDSSRPYVYQRLDPPDWRL